MYFEEFNVVFKRLILYQKREDLPNMEYNSYHSYLSWVYEQYDFVIYFHNFKQL